MPGDHRAAAVSMNRCLVLFDPLLDQGLGDEVLGQIAGLSVGDHPAGDVVRNGGKAPKSSDKKSPKHRMRSTFLRSSNHRRVPMLNKEDFAVIQALATRGVYQKDIAEELGVHPKTVRRALARGSAPPRERGGRGSKLAPYLGRIDQLIKEGVNNAVVVMRGNRSGRVGLRG